MAHGPEGPLLLAALGVVYGDIGTSPLSAIQTVFSIDNQAVQPTAGDVFGVVSLIFWSITLIVPVKYVVFVLRADNSGEGGVMALAALARWTLRGASADPVRLVMVLGVLGASLFYGDSVITPAIRNNRCPCGQRREVSGGLRCSWCCCRWRRPAPAGPGPRQPLSRAGPPWAGLP